MAIYASLTKKLVGYSYADEEEKEDTQATLTSLKAKLIKTQEGTPPW